MQISITVADKINLRHKVKGGPLTVRELREILRRAK
jgi:hypothetical protein